MKTPLLLPCVLGALGVLCVACTSSSQDASAPKKNVTITVTYVEPEKFTDVKDSDMGSDKVRDDYLEQLKEHIIEQATPYLADGQKFEISISDVDMAGDFEPWRGPRAQDIRIIKDIYPPRIELTFKLTGADGKVIAEGPRQLRDLNFMLNLSMTASNDSLRYEKRLLEDWLSNEFSAIKRGKK